MDRVCLVDTILRMGFHILRLQTGTDRRYCLASIKNAELGARSGSALSRAVQSRRGYRLPKGRNIIKFEEALRVRVFDIEPLAIDSLFIARFVDSFVEPSRKLLFFQILRGCRLP